MYHMLSAIESPVKGKGEGTECGPNIYRVLVA